MVYFIQCGDLVKIGTAANPNRRISELRSANPYPLTLRATMAGGLATELALHALFQADRQQGEWFALSPALEGLIGAQEEGHDLAPLIQRIVVELDDLPTTPRRRKLTDEHKAKLSQVAKERYARGELGGSKFGKLGGRPRKDTDNA